MPPSSPRVSSSTALQATPQGLPCALQTCQDATASNGGTDLFQDKVVPTMAQLFTVTYEKTYKVVRNVKQNETYVLYQCGTSAPVGVSATRTFQVPLQSVAVDDSTVLRFLELLGLQWAVQFLQQPYVTSACLLQQASWQQFPSLPGSWGSTSDQAKLRTAQVNAVSALLTSGGSSFTNSIAFTSTSETSPLARAEWIKFVALFFNEERAANEIFQGIRDRYLCRRQTALQAALSPGKTKPKVAWTSWYTYNSVSTWTLALPGYKLNLAHDAGADVIGPQQSRNDVSQFQALIKDADILRGAVAQCRLRSA